MKLKRKSRLVKVELHPVAKLLKYEFDYSGRYVNGFPYKPEIKNRKVITSLGALKNMCKKLMEVLVFAYDTETNTFQVLSDNNNFKCVGISISFGENDNYYIPLSHVRDEDIDRQLDLDVVVKSLQPVFSRKDVLICGWNLKFDFHVLKRIGITVETKFVFDGMLASFLINENEPNGLKENSNRNLGIPQEHFKEAVNTVPSEVKKQFGLKANSKATFDLVLIDDAEEYVLGDAFYTLCNCVGLAKKLLDENMVTIYEKMYIPFLFVLFDMEEQGVCVDTEHLKKMGEEMQADLDELQYKIYELSGVEFNIKSSQQKAEILFGYRKNKGNVNEHLIDNSFGFKVIATTKTGAPSTDNDTIWRLSRQQFKNKRKQEGVEMCKSMLEYSKLAKLKTAFVDGILSQLYADGKAHPSFNQIGTDSGRISCSQPNLQQLPKAEEDAKYQIRSAFIGSEYYVSPDGRIYDLDEVSHTSYEKKRKKIIAVDYHNLEMVVLTHFSGDKYLSEMFANDDDAHGSTAVNMFNLDCTPVECKKKYPHLRQAAKTINFLLMYGGGANLLYENLKNDHFNPLDLGAEEYLEQYDCSNGREVAQTFIDKYFTTYSGVSKFIRSQKRYAHKNGFVYTVLGRKRRLPDINSSDGAKSSYSERLSVNSAVQGTAGDITINAQIRISKEKELEKLKCKMLIQVHDELVFECPEENLERAIEIIKYDMEHPFGDTEDKMIKYLRADEGYGNNYQEAK